MRTRPPYPEEFKRRLVEFVRSGRTAESLAREFETCAGSIPGWVKQADLDEGRRHRLWVADITCVPTASGFLYLAVVIDAWSRRVVGWSMASHLKTKLVLDALNTAVRQRQPSPVIHHSDQRSQYTSLAFGQRCEDAGVRPSMASVGDAYDNALCESFFGTLECELIDRVSLRSFTHARREVFEYIEGWYNSHQRHSDLGYQSPTSYQERKEAAAA